MCTGLTLRVNFNIKVHQIVIKDIVTRKTLEQVGGNFVQHCNIIGLILYGSTDRSMRA